MTGTGRGPAPSPPIAEVLQVVFACFGQPAEFGIAPLLPTAMTRCSQTRSLLELLRYGDDPPAAAHLDHLQRCEACRRELAAHRLLEGQVRRVLRSRVEGGESSAHSWRAVRAEARSSPRAQAAPSRGRGLGAGFSGVAALSAAALFLAVASAPAASNADPRLARPEPPPHVAMVVEVAQPPEEIEDPWPPTYAPVVRHETGMLMYSDLVTIVRPQPVPIRTGALE